jgi:hypothetical protein
MAKTKRVTHTGEPLRLDAAKAALQQAVTLNARRFHAELQAEIDLAAEFDKMSAAIERARKHAETASQVRTRGIDSWLARYNAMFSTLEDVQRWKKVVDERASSAAERLRAVQRGARETGGARGTAADFVRLMFVANPSYTRDPNAWVNVESQLGVSLFHRGPRSSRQKSYQAVAKLLKKRAATKRAS